MGLFSESKILGLTLIFGVLFVSFYLVAQDFDGKESLSPESQEYIDNYANSIDEYNIDSLTENSVSEAKDTELFGQEEDTGFFANVDVLGSLSWFKEQWDRTSSFLYTVYNFPSFVFSLTGLPIEAFRHVTNIVVYIFVIGFAWLIKKFMSG